MKAAIIADLHLGSKEIGDGQWKQKALEEALIPKLRGLNPTHILFAGDLLDFTRTLSGDERPNLIKSASDQFRAVIEQSYLLMGNHDDIDSCKTMEHMGGPKIVSDDWVKLSDNIGVFFMRGRQDTQAACSALADVPTLGFDKKILLLHEDLPVFHNEQFLAVATEKFDLVMDGHNHVYRKLQEKVFLLPACLPWKAQRGSQQDVMLRRDINGDITIEPTAPSPWGFVLVEDDLQPEFVPLDVGVKIAICEVTAKEGQAQQAVREVLARLSSDYEPKSLVVRVYVSCRIDSELRAATDEEFRGKFFDDVQLQTLRGSGVVSTTIRDRLPTEEVALNEVAMQHGEFARRMVEELSQFFQLRNPRNRKDDILRIVKEQIEEGE